MVKLRDIQLNSEVWREGNMYVSYIPQLDLSSCGKTVDEAKKNINKATKLFIREARKMGTLEDILEEAGFTFDKSWNAPEMVAFERMQLAF